MAKKIESALISVYHKEGLSEIIGLLKDLEVKIYSTGGTQKMLEALNVPVETVENLTSYPSILGGRVKTLHPKVFGGILAKRDDDHLNQLRDYDIPPIDLVVVDLYPFEETLRATDSESEIIEKIDIGGISLIRAAAKNFRDTVVIPSREQYSALYQILSESNGHTELETRKELAWKAFNVSSHYDTVISSYFSREFAGDESLRISSDDAQSLRYGENPHQNATYFGQLEEEFEQLNGKALSYNNLVDIDAAIELMAEYKENPVTFAILKHTNSCGVATRNTVKEAYLAALAGDPISAFGGILISNGVIDDETAEEIDKQFYEVLIAPDFTAEAMDILAKKKNRVLLKRQNRPLVSRKIKSLLGGYIAQDSDRKMEGKEELRPVTKKLTTKDQLDQLIFANKVAKHLKSNTIVLANNFQLLGMGCGQTSRVDACKQAIDKAIRMGFDLQGAVMASDAFFPFPDCVEIASEAGIAAVIQPGGSRNDQLSIDFCDEKGIPMVMTGTRHFKH